MIGKPYRTSAAKADAAARRSPRRDAWELVVPFGILWLISVGRVVSVIASRAAFGVGDTFAVLMVVALPWLLFRAR